MRAEILRPKRTATSIMQCIYSSVSEASLQKTGVLLNSRRAERFSVAASLVGHPGDGWCADEGSKATPIYSNYIARN
jgi:hypothetical protein